MLKRYLDTDYEIDELGNCFSHKSNKFLKPQMSSRYPTYNLTIDGTKKKVKVHRMVAETFLPKVEGKDFVNHIDGNTQNFALSNLEWCNAQENSRHAIDTGLRPKGNQTINKYTENLPGEEWMPVNNYPNYVVSSCGRIMNVRTKRLLKQVVGNNGYYEVNLWKNNKGKTSQLHRLVYSHFTDDFNLDGFVINHKDGNKLNNNIENLEKVTYSENNRHAEYVIKTHGCGKKVIALDDDGYIIHSFPSIAEAQRTLGIANVSRAIKTEGKAGGYYWQYDDDN